MERSDLEYVGFWLRVGATLIDWLLIAVIVVPLITAIYGPTYWSLSNSEFIKGPADFIIQWVFPNVAIILFWIFRQTTPGKMAISARIVDAETGSAPSAGQMIGRYFAYFVSALPLCIGFIWIAFDRRKQGWHDKFAGTVVMRPRSVDTKEVAHPQSSVAKADTRELTKHDPSVNTRRFRIGIVGSIVWLVATLVVAVEFGDQGRHFAPSTFVITFLLTAVLPLVIVWGIVWIRSAKDGQ